MHNTWVKRNAREFWLIYVQNYFMYFWGRIYNIIQMLTQWKSTSSLILQFLGGNSVILSFLYTGENPNILNLYNDFLNKLLMNEGRQ
jgi:hypothetical protein